ncbi:hypothetical protein L3Q82_018667 [Scortum barcoo]|uniref:Uncharacterized protein n=1 Tax=Scortum barcoo TaxID=214431 RepID=A0ACB8VF98_9TELE|nr:hypothetical protein L3Q82_018667 [Scortum barcoo]
MPSKRDGLTSRGGSNDSGADVSLIDEELALQLGITQIPLSKAISASALDGHLLGTVTHQTEPVHMLLSGNHHETIQFHILHSPRLPLILGYPWLRRHNPHVDWLTGAILGWGSSCHQVCLRQAVVPQPSHCSSTPPDLKGVPSEYLDFREVFNKAKATSLPPHRPYDCAIDLQPGTTPPRGRLYSLSALEREAMEAYINDSLAAGIIRPSSSPAGAGFFFVEKKDKTLRPCIELRSVSSTPHLVSFLGFIVGRGSLQMDPAKVSAVTFASWPTPSSRKQLQRFLGFANFYRRFIRGYSTVAAPLTALTSSKVTFSGLWLPKRHSTPSKHEWGQCFHSGRLEDQKLHPCAFFSRRLSPAEKNYDIGNRELLAVKLALEEWRHWLEGSKQPFLVWTDHKNLEYIRSAKRLNSRQARWSLILTRFNFTLSYRPGSRNIKPDALSRQFLKDEDVTLHVQTPSSPSSHLVAPLTWEIEERVKGCTGRSTWAQRLSSRIDSLFLRLCSLTSFSGPTVPVSPCHPGIQRTIDVVRQRFWWATMNEDTRGFVKACPVCSRHKSSHHAPAGLLQPLPVPRRPWSHVSLDFVTGLPPSHGHTAILTVVDRFSKMAHFVPLPKLPSAKETMQN